MTAAKSPLDRLKDGGEERPVSVHPARWQTHQPITVRIAEAARMLGIGRSRIYELILSGDLEAVKLGRSTLIPVDALYALLERLRREQSDY